MSAIRVSVALIAFGAFILLSNPAKANDEAEQYSLGVAQDILKVVKAGGSPSEFRKLLKRHVAMEDMALFSLGKYAKKLKPSQREEYFTLVEGFIVKLFQEHAPSFNGDRVLLYGSKAKTEKDVRVSIRIDFGAGKLTPIKFRVKKRSSGFKVHDVNVASVWLLIHQKDQFVSKIREAGGKIEGLLEYLRKNS